MTAPPSITAALVTETLARAVVLPTAPPKVVTPAVLTVNVKAPSTVEPNVMLPLPVEMSAVFAESVTAPPYA